MAEEEVVAAAEAKAEAEAVSPVQSVPKTKHEENFNPQEEPVIVPQEIVVIPAEPVVVPLSAEAVSTVQSDHKRKVDEDLRPQNEVAAEPIVVPSAEAPVDWNEISIEVQNSIPDAKRPRLDEDFDRSNNLLSLENVEQLSEGNLEIGNPRQPSVENNQTTDGDYSSVGEDSSVGDLSSAQQQPFSENQTEIEVLNIEDEVKEKSIVEQEQVETTLVNHLEQHVSVTVKVDLTQYFVTDQVFDSREALIEWCQEVGRKNMSVVVISKSRKPVTGRAARLELGCERGGVYRDHKKKTDTPETKDLAKKRETGTRKCGCPFRLKGVWMAGDKWKVRVHCGEHNHELPETLVGHSYVARLKDEEKQILVDLTKSGVRPRQVLTTLKERSKENMSTMRTIYNARATLKLMETEGKSAMQQVMKLLVKHHYVEWHRRDETNELKDIFWAHPESIQLVKCFHSVLMVDCTYKANRFRTPLFEIVGITSTGKSFTVAFVFMESETEEHYTWAFTHLRTLFSPNSLPSVFITDGELALVNAINTVFPQAEQLLCTSHILKNVSENCKQHFERAEECERFMREWASVTKVGTKEKFVDALCDFVLTWASYPACVQYIRETWLAHKERFVLAWTKHVKHFGNTTTNSSESSHAKLKSQLGSSTSNFSTCWTAMHQMICSELIDIKASFEKSLISVRHEYMLPVFKELRGNVSHKALEFLLLEHNRSEDVGTDIEACGCVLRLSHGLPCAHEIVQFCREGRPIPLSEIDSHWRYLSAVPMPEQHCEFDYLPVVELIRQRWLKASEPERKIILEKLWEIAYPASR